MEQEAEITEEQAQEIRDKVKSAVFEGKPVSEVVDSPEEKEPAEEKQPEHETEADPLQGVPEPLKAEITALREQVKAVDTLSYRLKQAEQRIGSMTNKMSESEKLRVELERKLAEQPKPEEIAEKQKAEAAWDEFKDSEPEVATAIEARFSRQGKAPTTEELLAAITPKLEEALAQKLPKQDQERLLSSIDALAEDMVSIKHPNWESRVKTPEFKAFIEANPKHIDGCNSRRASDTIRVLDAFEEYAKTTKSAAQIKTGQAERIRAAAVKEAGASKGREKNIDDMTPDEIREMVKKKVFSEAT